MYLRDTVSIRQQYFYNLLKLLHILKEFVEMKLKFSNSKLDLSNPNRTR